MTSAHAIYVGGMRTMNKKYTYTQIVKIVGHKVINKFDIIPWIISSKGIIHRGCSTSIDAFLFNTKYFLSCLEILVFNLFDSIFKREDIFKISSGLKENLLISSPLS